jgi:ribonuclease HII
VVAAAVIMHASAPITEVNDSKLLTAAVRETLYTQIMERAASVGIGIVPSQIIDEINIYQATKLAMQHAIAAIDPPPDYLLIDGNMKLPVELPQLTIVKGDRLSFSVAAAGIVAKVTRDRLMMQFHDQFPQYGFAKHKGYATKIHREAILQHGPCPIHRTGFKGVKPPEFPLFASCNEEE